MNPKSMGIALNTIDDSFSEIKLQNELSLGGAKRSALLHISNMSSLEKLTLFCFFSVLFLVFPTGVRYIANTMNKKENITYSMKIKNNKLKYFTYILHMH